MMKVSVVVALATVSLVAVSLPAHAVDVSVSTTQTIVENVLDGLGVDADAALIDQLVSDVDPALLDSDLVAAVDIALADGSDPATVIDDLTGANLDEQTVLWDEHGDDWADSAPAVRPDRYNDDDGDDVDDSDDPETTVSPAPSATQGTRPSPTPRPSSTPRPSPTESDDDDDDDREGSDDDHSDDDD